MLVVVPVAVRTSEALRMLPGTSITDAEHQPIAASEPDSANDPAEGEEDSEQAGLTAPA